jgi:hypothetical protein
MLTVELRFTEDGREVSFDWLTAELAEKFARALKKQIAAMRNDVLSVLPKSPVDSPPIG